MDLPSQLWVDGDPPVVLSTWINGGSEAPPMLPAKCAMVLPPRGGHIKIKHALSLTSAWASSGPQDGKGCWAGVETLGRTWLRLGVEGSGRKEREQAAEKPQKGRSTCDQRFRAPRCMLHVPLDFTLTKNKFKDEIITHLNTETTEH